VEAVAELPSRQREAIACRYLRRMSIKETAEAMGCAEGTVKSAVSAALERMRDIMDQDR
jgi:RNA polymerase sigma-70 factor (ECF subfamily)